MNELVYIEKFRTNGLRFIPKADSDDQQLAIDLVLLYEKYEKDGFREFAIDFKNLAHLSKDVIVLILEVTARLRRRGGDLFVYNLHDGVLEDLLTFNPKSYLSVDGKSQDDFSKPEPFSVDGAESSDKTTAELELSPTSLHNSSGRLEIPYNEDELYRACDFVTSRADEMGFLEAEMSRIKIAVYEACLNAIQHTRKMNNDEKVVIEVETTSRKLQVKIHDRGVGFDVDNARDYDVTEAASHRKTGGMGLHIIKRAMDKVDYNVDPIDGNKLVMIKYLHS